MRLLWIGKAPKDEGAGDEIYDRKIIAELEKTGHAMTRMSPLRVSRPREVANLIAGVPYYRARYASQANLSRLRQAVAGCDAIVCSWEPFDWLASQLGKPVVQIAHNITSQALPSMYPNNPVVGWLGREAGKWERHAYASDRFRAVVALSRDDAGYLCKVMGAAGSVVYAPPGLPPTVSLADRAGFLPAVVLSGTYDWTVKRRDVLRFAKEWQTAKVRLPIFSDRLPGSAADMLRPKPLSEMSPSAGLRLGIICDRFEAGHKLKAGAYIAMNAMILSYADVSAEYAGIEDADFFVRRIASVTDILSVANELGAMDLDRLRSRWSIFQGRAASAFDWEVSARRIAAALDSQVPPVNAAGLPRY